MLTRSLATWTTGIGVAIAASVAMFSSCGDDSGGGGGGDATEVTITDGAQPTTASAGQLAVTFDGGTLETGTVVTLAPVDTPAEFSALTDVPAGSAAIDCTASKDGQPLAEAKAPFTIAITLNEAAALVDKTADNLCLLIKTATKKAVWRRAALTVDEAKTSITVKTPLFGTYMAAYCGDAVLEGFEDLSKSSGDDPGTNPDTSGGVPTAFPFACYQTPYKSCRFQRAADADQADFAAALAACTGGDQQGVASAQCPEENFEASCATEGADKWYYYTGATYIPTECEAGQEFSTEWSEG
jgi:hypothetical protein